MKETKIKNGKTFMDKQRNEEKWKIKRIRKD